MKKVAFALELLSCPSCIKRIENTLSEMAGVEEVKVMFNFNRVRAQFDESLIQADEIKGAIEKLGYPVTSQRVS